LAAFPVSTCVVLVVKEVPAVASRAASVLRLKLIVEVV
jgi:hypothetical protein